MSLPKPRHDRSSATGTSPGLRIDWTLLGKIAALFALATIADSELYRSRSPAARSLLSLLVSDAHLFSIGVCSDMLSCRTFRFPRFASLVVGVSLIVSAFLIIRMILIVGVSLIIGPLLLVRAAPVCILVRICGLACSARISLRSSWACHGGGGWGSGAPGHK